MPYELESIDVMVCGEKLTVYQASNAMDMERSYLIAEAQKEPVDGDVRDQYRHYLTALLYPSLVACTTGVIPNTEEFLYNLPAEESQKWISAARKLNPSWFTFLEPEVEESTEKKEP